MDDEEVIASHGVLAEQHEKPDDLLDNYFFLGEDDFEVGFDSLFAKQKKMITDPSRKECRAHRFAHVIMLCILCVPCFFILLRTRVFWGLEP